MMTERSEDSDRSADESAPHPLADLSALTPDLVTRLQGRWVDSVEGLVGITAADAGRESMGTLLGLTAGELDSLLDEARVLLGPEAFQKYATATRGGPTGVVLTDQQKKDMGIE